ncbi:MAG: MaoC family dehydratase N-terminal domain-containing protein [Myxococcota bacterium]|nr:MaoC family dehydratase N-terminal domain-containing protein [Myxococcota bacterium]
MLNKDADGKTGEKFIMEIERGKIYEFAEATQTQHPDYMSPEAPIIPPTFLTSQFFWEERIKDSNPWHLVEMGQERGMHAEQEYIFHGPPPKAGTRLYCQSRIDNMYEKKSRNGGMLHFASLVTEFRDKSGKLVAEAKMTGVETEKPPEAK